LGFAFAFFGVFAFAGFVFLAIAYLGSRAVTAGSSSRVLEQTPLAGIVREGDPGQDPLAGRSPLPGGCRSNALAGDVKPLRLWATR
jgi:hypothetical protein